MHQGLVEEWLNAGASPALGIAIAATMYRPVEDVILLRSEDNGPRTWEHHGIPVSQNKVGMQLLESWWSNSHCHGGGAGVFA